LICAPKGGGSAQRDKGGKPKNSGVWGDRGEGRESWAPREKNKLDLITSRKEFGKQNNKTCIVQKSKALTPNQKIWEKEKRTSSKRN